MKKILIAVIFVCPCLALFAQSTQAQATVSSTAPAVLSAADEEAVKSYLEGRIKFSAIPRIIEKVLSRHKNSKTKEPSLADIMASDDWARTEARSSCCR